MNRRKSRRVVRLLKKIKKYLHRLNSLTILPLFFIIQQTGLAPGQQTGLTPEQKSELIKISIYSSVGVIIFLLIFFFVKDRLMRANTKPDDIEIDVLKKRMVTLAGEKLDGRAKAATPEPVIEKPEVTENQADGVIEGDSLV